MKTSQQQNLSQDLLFEINYQVNIQDYINFSHLLFKDFINQKIKKSYISSGVMITVSCCLMIYIFITKQYDKYFVDFLILLMTVMSFYSILFYKKIFPKSLEKNSNKAFPNTKFYNQNINLKFFKNYLVETINNNQTEINFNNIIKTQVDDNLIVFKTNNQYLIIPKNNLSNNLLGFIYKNFVF